jgi:hypothetical protein
MQYNESQYNANSYNLTSYSLALAETVASSDDLTKSVGAVLTESQATADALGGNASLQAFLETVTIYQRARTQFAYNNGRYNAFMYNIRADEDEILLMATKALSDSIASTDATVLLLPDKGLLETLAESDVLSFLPNESLQEFLFLSELFRIEVTNKSLSDTVRLADWLSIERNPTSNNWGD